MLCLPHSVLTRFPKGYTRYLTNKRVWHAIFVKLYLENTLQKNLRFRT